MLRELVDEVRRLRETVERLRDAPATEPVPVPRVLAAHASVPEPETKGRIEQGGEAAEAPSTPPIWSTEEREEIEDPLRAFLDRHPTERRAAEALSAPAGLVRLALCHGLLSEARAKATRRGYGALFWWALGHLLRLGVPEGLPWLERGVTDGLAPALDALRSSWARRATRPPAAPVEAHDVKAETARRRRAAAQPAAALA